MEGNSEASMAALAAMAVASMAAMASLVHTATAEAMASTNVTIKFPGDRYHPYIEDDSELTLYLLGLFTRHTNSSYRKP